MKLRKPTGKRPVKPKKIINQQQEQFASDVGAAVLACLLIERDSAAVRVALIAGGVVVETVDA